MSAAPGSRSPGLTVFTALVAGALLIERRTGLLALATTPLAWEAETVAHLLLPLAALFALLRPASLPRLLAVSAAFLAVLWTDLPRGANHEIFLALLHASILTGAGWLAARGRLTPRALYDTVAPVLRWELAALYFWATLHKVNTAFLDPDLSCVTMQLYKLEDQFGLSLAVPEAVLPPLIWGTLILEGAIPVLLFLRPTRRGGIVLAALFHLLLGFNYPGFSAFLLGAFSLFVPGEALSALTRLRPRHDGLRTPVLDLVLVAACATAVRVLLGEEAGLALEWDHKLHYAVWALLVGAAALVPMRAPWPAVPARALMRTDAPGLLLFPLVVLLHGASPHLGWKNTQSLAMYSNLATEGGTTNHLVIPAWVRIDDHLDDLVEIHDANDPVLKLYARQLPGHNWNTTFVLQPASFRELERPPRRRWTFLLPAHMLKVRLAEAREQGRTGVWIDMTHDGRRLRLTDAESDPTWSQPTWLERTLLYARGVPKQQRGLCMW